MYVVKKDNIYLIDRNNDYYKVAEGLHIPKAKSLDLHLEKTLIDGEMVIDITSKKEELRYLIFDVILYENVLMRDMKFLTDAREQQRHQCMRMAIAKSFDLTIKEKILNTNPPFLIYYKVFYQISQASAILKENFPHNIDGLIFLMKDNKYQPGVDELQFMWMQPYRNTIDFYCRSVD